MSDVAAYWAGFPCALGISGAPAPFAYRRARGVRPSVSEAAFPLSLFGTLGGEPNLTPRPRADMFEPRVDDAPDISGVGMDPSFPAIPRGQPPAVGDLWIVQGAPGHRQIMSARALYLDQAVLFTPRMSDPLVVFTFSDIRRLWPGHGAPVSRPWNVRRGRAQRPADGGRVFIARTAKNGGRDPTPLREIMAYLLDRLPGRLKITRWPKNTGEGPDAPEVHCWGASPVEVLRGLLEAFRLEFDIGPDLRARFFRRAEGAIGEMPSGAEDNDPLLVVDSVGRLQGDWRGHITADGNRYARRPTGAPDQVLVVGDRTVYDVALDFCTPVLTYAGTDADGKPETVVLEVTPANLAALARGPGQAAENMLPDARDRHALAVILGAPAPPVPTVIPDVAGPSPETTRATTVETTPGVGGLKGGTFTVTEVVPEVVAETPDAHVWQRLPLLDNDAWERVLTWLPLGTRKLLREQLWRYYQIPIRRFGPLLRRAERNAEGERLEIQAEAVGFRAVRVRVRTQRNPSPAEIAAAAQANVLAAAEAVRQTQESLVESADRANNLRKLDFLRGEVPRLRAENARLREPGALEVLSAIKVDSPSGGGSVSLVDLAWPWRNYNPPPRPRGAVERAQDLIVIARAFEAFNRRLASWYSRLPFNIRKELPVGDEVARAAARGDTTEGVEQLIAENERTIAQYEREIAELTVKIDPKIPMRERLMQLEAQIVAAMGANGGRPPAGLLQERELLLRELQRQVAQDKATELREAKPEVEERLAHQNLGRRVVPVRVVDAALGIVEVLGDLPCWLADPGVKHASASYLIPMPVRVTFGSQNLQDVDGQREEPEGNVYMEAAAALLSDMPQDVADVVGDFGHVIPLDSAEGDGDQIRVGFVRDQEEPAEVGRYARAVTVSSPTFRELVRLDGSTNHEELVARARPVAQSLFDTPAVVDDGSISLTGPRQVGCNGRISATAVRLVPLESGSGFGLVTEVAFANDIAPLPDIVGHDRDGGPLRLTFGIDTEATRNR